MNIYSEATQIHIIVYYYIHMYLWTPSPLHDNTSTHEVPTMLMVNGILQRARDHEKITHTVEDKKFTNKINRATL